MAELFAPPQVDTAGATLSDASTPASAQIPGGFDLRALCRWIECFCVVNFDLELGQTLELTYPHCALTDAERTTIAFLSFPDSGTKTGNTVFSFRLRRSDGSFLFGFSYFLQEKNAAIPRGYLQKSVVLLSALPFVGLFRRVISIVGHMFFEYGTPLLEAACQNVSLWAEPTPGSRLELPVLGNIIFVHLPSASQPLLLEPKDSPRGSALAAHASAFSARDHELVASMQSINVYHRFFPLVSDLWLLYELVLLGEPLLLQADTPDVCSDAVFGLVSLVAPLAFGGDFRPFFNIHDGDFRLFAESPRDARQGLLLGVTNPFFRKAFEDWPHYVALDCTSGDGHGSFDAAAAGIAVGASARGKKADKRRRQSFVLSVHKPLLAPDKAIIKGILTDKTPTGQSADAHNHTLRQHFLELTEALLAPLERFFTTLMPFARSISAFGPPPRLKSFSRTEFLASLGATAPLARFAKRGGEQTFYARFLASPNFRSWYRARRATATARIRELYLHEVFHADIPAWLHGKSEVQAVDLLMRLRELLADHPHDPERVRARLREHIATVLATVSDDVRAALVRDESTSHRVQPVEPSQDDALLVSPRARNDSDPARPAFARRSTSVDGEPESHLARAGGPSETCSGDDEPPYTRARTSSRLNDVAESEP